MKLEEYGNWTRVSYKDGKKDWHPGHLTWKPIGQKKNPGWFSSEIYTDDIIGYSHYQYGKFTKGFGSEKNRVTIPEFEIVSVPTVNIRDVRQRRFNVIDRATNVKKQQQKVKEDAAVFESLSIYEDSEEDS